MEKLLIFGGTGTLGHALVEKYKDKYEIWVASRDETKQWEMKIKYPNVNFVLCDIRDKFRVKNILTKTKPDTLVLAAAMKHVDLCEVNIHECILTNIIGTKNILESLVPSVKTVCYVSTDKVCNPVNVYGMSKGISESLVTQYALDDKIRRYVSVRYGNVLNSRGSIIPTLHKIGQNPDIKEFKLTHPEMSRFIMTMEQCVDIVDHAIHFAESGDVVVPELVSIKISDLIEIFSEMYNKPIVISGLRPGEKLLESLVNETQSLGIVKGEKYMYIKPRQVFTENERVDYNSSINQISKESLKSILANLSFLSREVPLKSHPF